MPRWRGAEEPERLLEVREELKSEVYITAAMKEQQRREEEERRRREEEAKKDNVGERALISRVLVGLCATAR